MAQKMSAEAKEKLARFNAQQKDWYGTCRRCGAKLRGSMKELQEHRCYGEAEKAK